MRNLTTNSLKQESVQSSISDSDESHHIATARPVNYKEIKLDNTKMNTSTISDDLHDKSTDIVPKKSDDNSILEQLQEVKKKKKMTAMLSSSVIGFEIWRLKVSVLQIQ